MRKSNIISKVCAVSMAMVVAVTLMPGKLTAASYKGSNIVSNNIHDNSYMTTSKVSNSYMCVNPDGTLSRIENFGDIILYERYTSKFKLVSQSMLLFELTKFGGFYSGANYNYLVFGQDNPEHNNAKEIVRVVKYDKNWNRVGVISVTNCNTSVPFYLSNTSFAEYGAYLYIRCGHQTYDGKQGSMTIEVRTDTNTVEAVSCYPTTSAFGAVENSGASYIDAYNGVVTVAEKSLTAPAALLMTRYIGGPGANTFKAGAYSYSALGASDKLTSSIPEFTLGGYATNGTYGFAVGNSQPMDGTSASKDIVVVRTNKSTFNKQASSVYYLTGFAHGDAMTVDTPYLVKVNDNVFAIIWEQKYGYSDTLKTYYTFIDGSGNRISDNMSIDGCLSDCQPVVYGGNIVWYTTNGANCTLYAIPIKATSTPVYTATKPNSPATTGYAPVFDFNYYCNRYPDIRVLYGNDEGAALNHFINVGMAEGRQGCADFDVTVYAKNYPDLVAAYGGNYKAYYMHYLTTGFAEGRNGRTLNK